MTVTKAPNAQLPFSVGVVNRIGFTIGAEAANAISVVIQFKDALADSSARASLMMYVSGDANGDTIIGTAPTSIVIGIDGLLIPLVTGKTFLVTSESDGDVDITLGVTGPATYYLVFVLPDGSLIVSSAITFV